MPHANHCLSAQTEIQNVSDEPSAEDFLAREKALLGDDANQFATSDDATALADTSGDLLGESTAAESTFESQFPDLANPAAVGLRWTSQKQSTAER
jgi:hypothetical protein